MNLLLSPNAMPAAQINLVLQLLMGVALLAGMWLSRRKHFTAHGLCQSAVLLLNSVLIAAVMWRSFRVQVMAQIPGGMRDPYITVPAFHAALGSAAELLGIYIALVAGTRLIPEPLRFKNWKRWMRFELALWWAVIFLGVGTYLIWYAPTTTNTHAAQSDSPRVTPAKIEIMVSNFSFMAPSVTMPVGATVEWIDQGGRHTVEADDGSFKSPTMRSGDHFVYTFSKRGAYSYHCSFHGAAGGKDMAGTIIVR
jgi:plastocyanin